MLNSKLTFNLRSIISHFSNANAFKVFNCRSVGTKNSVGEEQTPFILQDLDDEETEAREAAIEKDRNKSELQSADFNRQHDKVPYERPVAEFHESLKYRRRLYGKYGESSKVNPSILWPSKKELEAIREYEEVVQPLTLKQLIENAERKRISEEEAIKKSEAEILEKVKSVKYELLAFHKRVAEAKKKALEIAEEKNKLVEQVRQHFGYKLQPHDEKFKQMLAELQKKEKKMLKAQKLQKRKELLEKESAQGDGEAGSEKLEKE